MKIKVGYLVEKFTETPDEKIKPLIDYVNNPEIPYDDKLNDELIEYCREVQDKFKERLEYIEYYNENTKRWELLMEG